MILNYLSVSIAVLSVILTVLFVRLTICLPSFNSRRRKRISCQVKTMLIFGSGGHTTELILLIKSLNQDQYSPIHCVVAHSDISTLQKVNTSDIKILQSVQGQQNPKWHTVYRSREVRQSWWSTVFTTLMGAAQSLALVLSVRPELIICNGPGTCVPICYAAFALRLLGACDCRIVFVESFCRVQSLSLSGRLLYPIADKFVVQWPGLLANLPRAEYLGDITAD